MADVPDQPVAWRVEYVVQCDGELNDTESGAEMAARHRDRIDQLQPQLLCELWHLPVFETPQVVRLVDAVKQRRLTFGAHAIPRRTWEKGPKNWLFLKDPYDRINSFRLP
jgi:hypothetical protein